MVWGRKSGHVPSPQKHCRRRDLMDKEHKRRQRRIRRLVYLNFEIKDLRGPLIRKACLWFWYRGPHRILSRLRSRPSHNDLLPKA